MLLFGSFSGIQYIRGDCFSFSECSCVVGRCVDLRMLNGCLVELLDMLCPSIRIVGYQRVLMN